MADQQTPPPVVLWAAGPAAGPAALGRVLVAYRAATGLTQLELGDLLGFTQPYLSRLERGDRTIGDVATLQRIAARLGIPARLLGVTDPETDPPVALELARPALRLAILACQAGQALQAAQELWPVVALLEAGYAAGRRDLAFLRLLTEARATFGTTLGHVLPTERLGVVVAWTDRAVQAACQLRDPSLEAVVRCMHGNELRKAGQHTAAVEQLRRAVILAGSDPAARGAALVLLGRAAAEAGHGSLFDQATTGAARLLDASGERAPLVTAYVLAEVRLRGAVRLKRRSQVAKLLHARPSPAGGPPSPLWGVLEAITHGEALLALGELTGALADFARAVPAASDAHLPQQLGRVTEALTAQRHDPAARELAHHAQAHLDALSPVVVSPPGP